jgi:succinate dehydrogenase/fumarate reductase flavoprotein subunit
VEAERSAWARERMAFYSALFERQRGAQWKEANLGLQQIMADYAAAGPHRVRSATLLQAGLKYLGDLRANARAELKAGNAHELLRAAEVFDLMDNGQVVMHAALERKETRGMHVRSDYPFTNPLLSDKFLTVRQENGQMLTEWRQRWNA